MAWSHNDTAWLSQSYPDLHKTSTDSIKGIIVFSMLRSNGAYIVNPSIELINDKSASDHLYIADGYSIEITWASNSHFPDTREIGGRLKRTADKFDLSLLDMHQHDVDGTLCLTTAMDLERTFKEGFSLPIYIEELLIPYLYAQSHFEETKKWLWGELSHGYIGLMEWLARQEQPSESDIEAAYRHIAIHLGKDSLEKLMAFRWRGNMKCLCSSRKQTRDCHPEIQRAISLLRSQYQLK